MKTLALLATTLLVSCATPQDAQELSRQLDALNRAVISYTNATTAATK
jgi:hypothetical protein